MALIEVKTEEQFNQEVKTGISCVDFWAPWCGPCKVFSPIFETAASSDNRVKYIKVNIDDLGQLAHRFKVKSIPTVLLLENGEPKKIKVGSMNPSELEEFVKS